ncbi:FAD-dependent oxidoreductase, partial [Alistipes sp. OttesenSCG-928-B03]|nr:FAD-dependent oxidoreductase [Alistipes sp. OttesenSCG-928-B03]
MKVIVIGGGPAGMQAAATLREQGIEPVIIDREEKLGGKLNRWHKLFPTLTPAREVLYELRRGVDGVEVLGGVSVDEITDRGVMLAGGREVEGDAVIVATGFDLFRAELKEEYGYGIYDNVYTSVDIEDMLNGDGVRMRDGSIPRRIAFLHCVGSRDEKVGQRHCSRVCCITAVKQAMEMREIFPECDVYNFYMDIRMFGPGYEEMYRSAQEEANVNFIRGRISEASETIDKRIQIKAEDTLIGRPLKMSVDMLVLVVGMTAAETNSRMATRDGVQLQSNGFIAPRNPFAGNVLSGVANVFYAGAVTAPKNIGESINEGTAAAIHAARYVK